MWSSILGLLFASVRQRLWLQCKLVSQSISQQVGRWLRHSRLVGLVRAPLHLVVLVLHVLRMSAHRDRTRCRSGGLLLWPSWTSRRGSTFWRRACSGRNAGSCMASSCAAKRRFVLSRRYRTYSGQYCLFWGYRSLLCVAKRTKSLWQNHSAALGVRLSFLGLQHFLLWTLT